MGRVSMEWMMLAIVIVVLSMLGLQWMSGVLEEFSADLARSIEGAVSLAE